MKKSAPRATLSTEAIETLLSTAIARARELDIRVHVAITDSAAANSTSAATPSGSKRPHALPCPAFRGTVARMLLVPHRLWCYRPVPKT